MKIREKMLRKALSNWTELNKRIADMNDKEVEEALRREERRSSPRATFVRRLKQRLNSIRTDRVRVEV